MVLSDSDKIELYDQMESLWELQPPLHIIEVGHVVLNPDFSMYKNEYGRFLIVSQGHEMFSLIRDKKEVYLNYPDEVYEDDNSLEIIYRTASDLIMEQLEDMRQNDSVRKLVDVPNQKVIVNNLAIKYGKQGG